MRSIACVRRSIVCSGTCILAVLALTTSLAAAERRVQTASGHSDPEFGGGNGPISRSPLRNAGYERGPRRDFVTPANVEAEFGSELMQRYYVDYDRGLVIRPHDPKANPFELKFNSWLQLRGTVFDSDGPNRDATDIEFERLRILFSGYAISRDLKYFIQLDMDDDQTQRLDALDYYISYDIGHDQLELEPGSLGIRAGRWKIPFNRSRYTSGLKLQFADRSMAGVFFDIDRSVGASFYGKEFVDDRPVNWELALINGVRTNGARPSRAGDIDRNLAVSGRIFSDLVGEYGNDGEPDLSYHECLAVRVGGGFANSRIDGRDGPLEFARQRVVDSGATIATTVPAGVNRYTLGLYEFDVNFKYRGWSMLTEFFFRNMYDFNGGVPSLFDHGFLVQTGYFIVPKKLELLARYSRIVGDSGTLGTGDQSADEVAGGIAWYIRGQNVKFVFDVSHFNGAPLNDTALNLRPGDAGWLLRSQMQIWF